MYLIDGCSRKRGRDKGIRLYRFPAVETNQGPEVEEMSTERRRLWISATTRDRVCDQHFHSGTAASLWDRYNIDWVPTLNLGHGKLATQRVQNASREARAEKYKKRRKRQAELQEQERFLKQQKLNEPGIHLADFASEIESSTTPGSEQVHDETVDLQLDEQERHPNEHETHHTSSIHTEAFVYLYRSVLTPGHEMMPQLKQKSLTTCLLNQQRASPLIKKKKYIYIYFREDNGKVSFYTGLPTCEVLEATFDHASPFVKRRTQSLTLFQEMVMVLMKLRRDVPHQDLAYRFGVSQSTVSRTFAHWLLIMDIRLSPLIRWPEREELWKTMPQCFSFFFGNNCHY